MEYRNLGACGLKFSVLSFGTGTFGGQGPLFSALGRSGADEARRLVAICLDTGVNLFDLVGPEVRRSSRAGRMIGPWRCRSTHPRCVAGANLTPAVRP